MSIEASLKFKPDMKIDVDWNTTYGAPVIDSGKVLVIGTIRADMDVRYQFDGSYEWGTADNPKEGKLKEYKWEATYTVGGVPVYQETTLTWTFQAWATATAAIDAEANAFAETEIQVGVRYNETGVSKNSHFRHFYFFYFGPY